MAAGLGRIDREQPASRSAEGLATVIIDIGRELMPEDVRLKRDARANRALF
jgi:hypothetical protein